MDCFSLANSNSPEKTALESTIINLTSKILGNGNLPIPFFSILNLNLMRSYVLKKKSSS